MQEEIFLHFYLPDKIEVNPEPQSYTFLRLQ